MVNPIKKLLGLDKQPVPPSTAAPPIAAPPEPAPVAPPPAPPPAPAPAPAPPQYIPGQAPGQRARAAMTASTMLGAAAAAGQSTKKSLLGS